jgi:hypothetical protein
MLLPLASYVHAIWLYDQADFQGLSLAGNPPGPVSPRWYPYASQDLLWLLLPVVAVAAALADRRVLTGPR